MEGPPVSALFLLLAVAVVAHTTVGIIYIAAKLADLEGGHLVMEMVAQELQAKEIAVVAFHQRHRTMVAAAAAAPLELAPMQALLGQAAAMVVLVLSVLLQGHPLLMAVVVVVVLALVMVQVELAVQAVAALELVLHL